MDRLTDSHLVSRLEVVETGRRRRWTDEEKLRIVEESFSGPRLASVTARRHGLSKQLVFTWRKLYREGRLGSVGGFVPATIVPEASEKTSKTGCGRIEIVSANGRRIIVDRDADVAAVLRLVRGLEALP
jgi:transposase